MNSKVASFDESKGNLKNNISDEQPLKITDSLHESDLGGHFLTTILQYGRHLHG